MRLFLLPYAGANMYAYKILERTFPVSIVLNPLELPGRGRRFNEQLITEPSDAVEDIIKQMKPFLQSPYAIFGHSMGAVLGYLVTKRLIAENLGCPIHLFCSGKTGLVNRSLNWHSLPSTEFWKKIFELGGLPEGSYANDEIKSLFEPILKADFKIMQRAEQQGLLDGLQLNIPLTVLLGRYDKIVDEDCTWHLYTKDKPAVHYFDGGHFFFIENSEELVKIIMNVLANNV